MYVYEGRFRFRFQHLKKNNLQSSTTQLTYATNNNLNHFHSPIYYISRPTRASYTKVSQPNVSPVIAIIIIRPMLRMIGDHERKMELQIPKNGNGSNLGE
jgi:hypothetical protein